MIGSCGIPSIRMGLITLSSALLLFFSCGKATNPEPEAGTVSQTKNVALVSGHLLSANGLPARNRVVRFVPAALNLHDTSAIKPSYDSTYTDASGWYGINTLNPGTYNILGSDNADADKSYRPCVGFSGDTLKLPADTLLPVGSLNGAIQLQPGDDPRTVTVDALGALASALPKINGEFALAKMARGSYRVRIRSSDPKYAVLDTVLPIVSGKDSIMANPISLPLKIPIPTGFLLKYDSLTQMVSLSWNKMPFEKVSGYNIYRQRIDSADIKLNAIPLSDTLYKDSSAVQDSTYIYRVASVDSLGREGLKTRGDTVHITSVFKRLSTFGGKGTGPGKFTEISDVKHLKNGRIIALDGQANLVQLFDGDGCFLFSWGSEGASDGQFKIPIAVTEDDSGYLYILEMIGAGRIQKFDGTGHFLTSWIVGRYCTGLTYYSGKLYIACPYLPGFKTIDLRNNNISAWEIPGMAPAKITIDEAPRIYMTDDSNNKILISDTAGTLSAFWGIPGTQNGEINSPGAITTDGAGRIFLADKNNGRLQVFNSQNAFITKFNLAQIPAGATQVNNEKSLRGISIDKAGRLCIADMWFIYILTAVLP